MSADLLELALRHLPQEKLREMLQAITGVDPTPQISVEAFSSNDVRLCNMPPQASENPGSELPHLFAACLESIMRANVQGYCDRVVITIQLPGSEPVDLSNDRFYQFKTGVKLEDLPLAQAEAERLRTEAAEDRNKS